MTGRDLIIYILNNGLEDELLFKDGKLLGFMTIKETADKFNIGEATVRVWISMNMIKTVSIGEYTFIPGDIEDPRYTKGADLIG